MKPPRPTTQYPDRALDCELTVESYIQELLDNGAHVGWSREELMEAILHVTAMIQLAEESDAGLPLQISSGEGSRRTRIYTLPGDRRKAAKEFTTPLEFEFTERNRLHDDRFMEICGRIPMHDHVSDVLKSSDTIRPKDDPSQQVKDKPVESPDASHDKQQRNPVPIAPELLPIGDPAGAA